METGMNVKVRRRSGLLSAGLPVVALLISGASAAAGSVGAEHARMPQGTRETPIRIVERRVFLAKLRCGNWLSSVEATSASDAWATGGIISSTSRCRAARAFAVHWNGRKWAIVHYPDPTFVAISVHASSPRNVWFFGDADAGLEALRWNGSWHVMTIPQVPVIWRPVVLGPDDVWMSDTSSWTAAGWRTPLWHWDGTTWTEYYLPVLADDLFGIAGLSERHLWAAGIQAGAANPNARGRLAVYHWGGTSWRPADVPDVSLKGPAQVAVSASGVVWITGYHRARLGLHRPGDPVALYRIGGSWKRLPEGILLRAVDGINQPVPDGFDGADLGSLYWSGHVGLGDYIQPLGGGHCPGNGYTWAANGTAIVGIPGTRSFLTVGGCQLTKNVNGRWEGVITITTPR
jgi:hypothetical protein